jgi:hypothetical protein
MSLILSGTNGLSDVDGSAATPAIRGTDTNTGIFFPAADTIAFAEGGTEAMRLDSSGNLGVGTTSPSSRLHVYNNINGAGVTWGNATKTGYLYQDNSGIGITDNASFTNGLYIHNTSTFVALYTGGSERARIDSSGNLLVGGTSNSGALKILATDGTVQVGLLPFAAGSIAYAGTWTNHAFGFATNGTEKVRIDTSGNLLVGKTTTSATSGAGVQFQPSGYVNAVTASSTNSFSTYELYSTGAGAYRFFVGAGGTVYATSTTISSLSDARYKENVRDLNVGLAEVMALKPRLYDWKEGKGADIKNARGFIAQEFEEVFPDLIDEWRDPAPEGEEPYKSVRADLIPVLVKAIQELKAEFDAYKLTHP